MKAALAVLIFSIILVAVFAEGSFRFKRHPHRDYDRDYDRGYRGRHGHGYRGDGYRGDRYRGDGYRGDFGGHRGGFGRRDDFGYRGDDFGHRGGFGGPVGGPIVGTPIVGAPLVAPGNAFEHTVITNSRGPLGARHSQVSTNSFSQPIIG